MFRFVFAWTAGEPFEALAADGFIGVESDDDPPAGVPVVGGRIRYRSDEGAAASPTGGGFRYSLLPSDDRPPHVLGRLYRDEEDRRPDVEQDPVRHRRLFENGGRYVTPHALWALLEAVGRPTVGLALDVDVATASGQSATTMVPTLNLRIVLVRVHRVADDTADYARRLAGIGFDGYVVCDPPAGTDRPQAAIAIANAFRAVLPAKPVKKPVVGRSAKA